MSDATLAVRPDVPTLPRPRPWLDRCAKRVLDVVLSATGLVLSGPLLLACALWIRLDSKGPALFRQERVGQGGRTFRIHKLRTMHVADVTTTSLAVTSGRDPRITRAGAFLRASKLDELPQLIDVLAGDMSLVGPRPEVPRYVELYPPALRATLLSVRPGITDPASIAYRHEQDLLARAEDAERCYREEILPAKLALAADYVARASFARDLGVLVRTARALFARS